MRLISAEVEYYCQFKRLTTKFAPSLTAILGRNGSGKSNLIKAIFAALTGDFGRNDGLKTDNISQFAPLQAISKVNVVIEHGGTILDITRGLRPVSTKLRIITDTGVETVITKSQEATDAILGILGVSSRMLDDYVFVDQWAIFNFLAMMPSERAKAFQRLFRTERAEALWKMLGTHNDSIVIPTPGIDKDAVIKRTTEQRQHYVALSATLKALDADISRIDISADRNFIASWQRKNKLEEEKASLQAEIKHIDNKDGEIRRQINELRADATDLRDYVLSEQTNYNEMKQLVGFWTTYEALDVQRKDLLSELDSLRQQGLTLVNPKKPKDYEKRSPGFSVGPPFWPNYELLKKRVEISSHFMNLLKQDDILCPTCGTPRHELEKHRAEYEALHAKDTVELARQTDIVKRSAAYDREYAEYTARATYLKQESANLIKQLNSIIVTPRPAESFDQLRSKIHKYETTDKSLKQTESALALFERKHSELFGARNQLQKECDLCTQELLTIWQVTEDQVIEAQHRLDTHDTLMEQRARLRAEIEVLDRAILDDEFALGQLEAIERDAERTRAWLERCKDMRHILHRDNLPKVAAINYLELMQDEINSLLLRFDSPFQVTADAHLSFIATFKDGRQVPATRLSGGEKVLLALAFRVAVNDIFARDLGLLILDEPTAGLDEGNLGCLRIAIERLKELSSSRGLQVVMITHERDLHNMFDHVVEIGKE